jgi:ATP-dependent protease ClpP protease subunit
MIKLAIDTDIGYWGITADMVAEQLKGIADGEEIEVTINSPGGSVYQGIAIFNIIRDHAKTHPVSVVINGLAASMAAYIALAARTVKPESKITVMDNSLFMIHNPTSWVDGDYREFQREADFLARLTAMFAAAYSAVSKQKQDDIRAAMDAEAWYLGQEIADAGFANCYEQTVADEGEGSQDKDALIITAKVRVDATMKKSTEEKQEDRQKAVTLLQNLNLEGAGSGAGSRSASLEAAGTRSAFQHNHISDGGTPADGGQMTPEELLAKHPDCYKAVIAMGESGALAKEKERVAAHLKLGRQAGNLEVAAKFIEDGKSVMSEEVQSEYLSLRMGKQALDNRNADNPPPLNTGGGDGAEDDAKLMAAFDAGLSGKEFGGTKAGGR